MRWLLRWWKQPRVPQRVPFWNEHRNPRHESSRKLRETAHQTRHAMRCAARRAPSSVEYFCAMVFRSRAPSGCSAVGLGPLCSLAPPSATRQLHSAEPDVFLRLGIRNVINATDDLPHVFSRGVAPGADAAAAPECAADDRGPRHGPRGNRDPAVPAPPRYLRISLEDVVGQDITAGVTTAVAFLGECLAKGERTLVHCAQGKSRSAALVTAWLMHRCGPSQAPAVEAWRSTCLGACWWGVCSMPQHTERCSLLPLGFSLLGHIRTHDRLNMSNETVRHLAIVYVNKMEMW